MRGWRAVLAWGLAAGVLVGCSAMKVRFVSDQQLEQVSRLSAEIGDLTRQMQSSGLSCGDTCRLSENICEAAAKICEIADESRDYRLAQRCLRARAHCEEARDMCRRCGDEGS